MAEELERPPLKDIYRKLIADNETNEVFKKYSYNSFRDRMLNNPDASSEVADFLIDRGIIRDKEDWQQNWLAPSVVKQAPAPTKSAHVQVPTLLQPAQPEPVQQPVVEAQPPIQEQPVRPPVQPVASQPEEPGFFSKMYQGAANLFRGFRDVFKNPDAKLENEDNKIGIKKNVLEDYEKSQKAHVDSEKEMAEVKAYKDRIRGGLKTGMISEEDSRNVDPKVVEIEHRNNVTKEQSAQSLAKVQPEVEKITTEIFNKMPDDAKYKVSPSTNKKGVNYVEVEKWARGIAKEKGLPETGFVYSLIKNRLHAKLEYEAIKPDIEKKAEELFTKQTGTSIKDAQQKEFLNSLSSVNSIKKQAEIQVQSIGHEAKTEAKKELNSLSSIYTKSISQINDRLKSDPEVVGLIEQISKTDFQAMQDAVSKGLMTVEEANAKLQSPEYKEEFRKKIDAFTEKKYGQEYKNSFSQYLAEFNKTNTRYNAKAKRMAQEVIDMANREIAAKVDAAQKNYKLSPELKGKIELAYKKAQEEVFKSKDMKEFAEANRGNPITSVVNSFNSSFGAGVKGAAIAFNMPDLATFGDFMEQEFDKGGKDSGQIKKASDLLHMGKFLNSFGDLMGRMTPGLAAAAAVGVTTKGIGMADLPAMLMSSFTGAGAETADIVGSMYNDVLSETGDAAKAREAAYKSFKSQVMIAPTYALEALPFFPKLIEKAGKKMGVLPLAATGAGIEFVTEMFQEVPQNAFEETIKEGGELGEAYKKLTLERIYETGLQIAPVALLGGAPHLFSGTKEAIQKSLTQRAVKAYLAKTVIGNVLTEPGRFQFTQDLLDKKGANFANSMVGTLYTQGKITEDEMKELVKNVELYDKFNAFAKKNEIKSGVDKNAMFALWKDAQIAAETGSTDSGLDAVQAQQAFKDFITTGRGEVYTTTLSDGTVHVYTADQLNQLLDDADFQKLIKDGLVTLNTYAKENSVQLYNINQKINQVIKNPGKSQNVSLENRVKETENKIKNKNLFLAEVDDAEWNAFVDNGTIDPLRLGGIVDDVKAGVDMSQMDERYRAIVEAAIPQVNEILAKEAPTENRPAKGRKQIEKTLSDLTETQDPLSRLNLIHNFNRTVGLAPDAATEEESSLIQKEKEKLEAEGYEVIDLTGQKFDPGLRVLVEQSIPDENLEEGQEIISRVIAPQINKDGKMVQPARIVVTVGTKQQTDETTTTTTPSPALLGETTKATGQTGGGLGTDVPAVDEQGTDQIPVAGTVEDIERRRDEGLLANRLLLDDSKEVIAEKKRNTNQILADYDAEIAALQSPSPIPVAADGASGTVVQSGPQSVADESGGPVVEVEPVLAEEVAAAPAEEEVVESSPKPTFNKGKTATFETIQKKNGKVVVSPNEKPGTYDAMKMIISDDGKYATFEIDPTQVRGFNDIISDFRKVFPFISVKGVPSGRMGDAETVNKGILRKDENGDWVVEKKADVIFYGRNYNQDEPMPVKKPLDFSSTQPKQTPQQAEPLTGSSESEFDAAVSEAEKLGGTEEVAVSEEFTPSPFSAFDTKGEQGRKARAALKEKVGKAEFAKMELMHKKAPEILKGLEQRGVLQIICP